MPQILYFSAPWCSKCKITGPAVKAATSYYNLLLEEINCDDDKNESLIKKYNIMSLPVIIVLQHGKEVYRTEGFKTAGILIEEFANFI